MASRRGACLALLAASLLFSTPSHADPTAADRETARSLMQEGRDLRDKGDLREALKRFKAADDIMHVPTTALEVARVQVSLGLLVEARDTVAAMRQTPSKRSDPAPFTEARAKAEELDASLNGRVPALKIAVKGVAAGEDATVAVDGVPVAPAALGLPRSVDPGHHVVTAKTSTGEGKAEVDVREGEQKPVEVTLASTAPPETAAPTPPAPTEPETPEPATRSHSPTALTWVGVGVAGAGVIAGSVTGFLSLSKTSSLNSACQAKICGPSNQSGLDSANMLATVSDVAFAAAGVGAVVAIVSLVVGHGDAGATAPQSSPADAAIRVTPWFGLGAGGVRGTF
jgi:hypothetical protein